MIIHEIQKTDYLPQLMKSMSNWVLYALYSDPRPDDPEHRGKYPIDPKPCINRIGGIYYKGAKANDPNTWSTFSAAVDLLRRMIDKPFRIPKPIKTKDGQTEWQHIEGTVAGLGFELEGSGITCIDIDNRADEIQAYRDGRRGGLIASLMFDIGDCSYCEVSQSGNGLHIFTKGHKPSGSRSKGGGLEIYDSRRFIAMTGNVFCNFHSMDDEDHSQELGEICDHFMPQPLPSVSSKAEAQAQMRACNVGITKALETAIRTNRKFSGLWLGDRSAYIDKDDPGGGSADLALCNILCYYLGGDYALIDEAFRYSGLMRPKWDELRGDQTYGEITLNKSILLYGNDRSNYFAYADELKVVNDEELKTMMNDGGFDDE